MHLERHVSREEMLDTSSQKKLHWKLEEDFARLSVNTEPPGLEVRVDGKPAGKSPIQNLELSIGGHVIEAGGDRCRQSHKKQISLSRGETATETLEPVMIPAGLMVRAKDEDGNALEGDVFLDGQKIGRTLEALRVSVCVAEVEVRTDSGARMTATTALKARQTETVEVQVAPQGNPRGKVGDGPQFPTQPRFSMEDFESASFNAEVKSLQARQATKRRGLIGKMEALLAREPYFPQRARVYFQLAESYWQVNKYEYLLNREEYKNQLDAFEEGRLTIKPDEPREDYSISLSYYRKILQEFPDYPRIDEVIYYLGRGAMKLGKENEDRQLTREGVSYFQKLEQNYPKSRFIAESILALAEYHFEFSSFYPAKVKYEKIITHYPRKGMVDYARYKLGWVYFNLGEFDKANDTFHTVVSRVSSGTTRGMVEFKDAAVDALIVCHLGKSPDGWRSVLEYLIPDGYFAKEPVTRTYAMEKMHRVAAHLAATGRHEERMKLMATLEAL